MTVVCKREGGYFSSFIKLLSLERHCTAWRTSTVNTPMNKPKLLIDISAQVRKYTLKIMILCVVFIKHVIIGENIKRRGFSLSLYLLS